MHSGTPATVSIIIVSYNCRDALRQCLAALTRDDTPHSDSVPSASLWFNKISSRSVGVSGHGSPVSGLPPPRLLVIDNASSDQSAEMVRTEFPDVTLITNTDNRGFAAACNQGIKASTSNYVLLLNPDTIAPSDALSRLISFMDDHPEVGACGPRILHEDGSLQRSCRRFPTLSRLALSELGWRRPYRMLEWAHDDTREVDQLMGSCLLLRRSALDQVGLLDERFFVYFEEVDLCLRLHQAGWKVMFVHDAVITHTGGQSSKHDRSRSMLYAYRSMFVFYRKHYPRWHLVVLKSVVQLATVLRLLTGFQGYSTVARQVWRL